VVARFSITLQGGPQADLAFCRKGTTSLSQGIKQPGHGVGHPLQTSIEMKERVDLFPYPDMCLQDIYHRVNLPFYLWMKGISEVSCMTAASK